MIVTDITVNWTVYATIGGNPLFGVINQTLFAALLIITASTLWHWFTKSRNRPPAPPPH
ncbi:hypothetical protein [Leucobacter sp. wl10]|uniref:hypothetical protein n=1 Tax=Leucobacter sp. wl10 TaxID=2304677 RepID=UPI0013C2DE97|nr:hypothetical protein [Leucobacter sp. wl10]